MANVNKPFGFRLSRKRGKCLETNQYVVGGVQQIYEGQAVSLQANGTVLPYQLGGKILGVAAHRASGGESVAVHDDPEAVFEAQATTATEADVGANATIAPGAFDPLTERSEDQIDGATFAATADLPFKVLGLADRDGNEAGAFATVYVKLNNSVKGSGDGSTGV